MKILVVDDSPVVTKLLKHILNAAGHQCVIQNSFSGAIMVTNSERYDQIILDDHIDQGKTCEDLILKIRESRKNTKTPIIVISASFLPERKAALETLAGVKFEEKPQDYFYLLKYVKESA